MVEEGLLEVTAPLGDEGLADAGPKNNEFTIGIALAGRSSANPGISGMPTLKGIKMAA